MRKLTGLILSLMFVISIAALAGCQQGPKGDPMLGTWAKVDSAGSTISITKEGEQYFYSGAYGKAPATKVDENTMTASMPPFELSIKLDPASGVLTVSFAGEEYQYKKAQQ